MKILYGVQGTGNGHVTRAIAMTHALSKFNPIELDILISGRAPEPIAFHANRILWRRGMTFITQAGRVQYGQTIIKNNLPKMLVDIKDLDSSHYDLILTDYEPVVAWAAKLSGKSCIGIGHQYAFKYKVPMRCDNIANRTLMRNFAPAARQVGLHWHHFDHPILPPIIDIDTTSKRCVERNKVVVYLPFEEPVEVISLLKKCPGFEFYVYHPNLQDTDEGNIHCRRTSRTTFKNDLVTSNAVICNTGFELISEALALGIKILTKPLAGQVEQLSNGAALAQLDYATVKDHLFLPSVEQWLGSSKRVQINYPNVQHCLARWLASGAKESVEALAEKMWRDVKVSRLH